MCDMHVKNINVLLLNFGRESLKKTKPLNVIIALIKNTIIFFKKNLNLPKIIIQGLNYTI